MSKVLNWIKIKKKKTTIIPEEVDATPISFNSDPKIKKPTEVKISRPTNETHYQNDHRNIGVALIFNHANVPGHPVRAGTERDKERIKKILDLYGFDVRLYDDLTYTEIAEVLKEVSEEDHSNNDCLLVVVMSHGLTGHICSADHPYLVDNLWTPFLGENCKTLLNKPKLFFIQACRGIKADVGANYRSARSHKSQGFDEADCKVSYTIPSTADTLIFYATYDGHVSFRNKIEGSWFIQSISLLLEQYLKDRKEIDLFHFITAVSRKVAYEYQSCVRNNLAYNDMKAMPNFVSTLTKLFILKPKPKRITN